MSVVSWIYTLCEFPIAAVTNYHKTRGVSVFFSNPGDRSVK